MKAAFSLETSIIQQRDGVSQKNEVGLIDHTVMKTSRLALYIIFSNQMEATH